jgi:hypothetical protein
MNGLSEQVLVCACHGNGAREMTMGETNIFLVFLVMIGVMCALIEHLVSRSDASNSRPPRLDPDRLEKKWGRIFILEKDA